MSCEVSALVFTKEVVLGQGLGVSEILGFSLHLPDFSVYNDH